MKRMFMLFGLLALVGVLFVACDGQQDLTSPEEAAFKKGQGAAYTCTLELQAQKDALDATIDAILLNVKSRKGAHQNVDNMARNVCAEPPDYDAALYTYSEFEIEINLQNVDKLAGGETGRQALLDMAYTFASGGDYNPGFSIPPEAFGPDGGLFVIPTPGDIPPEGLELVANSYEGALRVLPGTFPDDAFPVTVVEYRLPDDYTGGDGYDFGEYAEFLTPEIWFFDASAQVDPAGPGIEVWVCLVEDLLNDPYLYDRSVIAHATDEGGVELLDGDDRLTENPPAGLDCLDAGAYQTASAETSIWSQLAASVLKPVTSFLGVKPLNAMYFAGKGLGGRGGALSPFGPVDVLDQPQFLVSCTTSGGSGTLGVTGEAAMCGAGATLDIDDGTMASSTFAGGANYPAGTELTFVASPGTGYQLGSLTGCDGGTTDPCVVTVNGNRPLSASFTLAPGPHALALSGGTAAGTISGYYTAPRAEPLGDPDFQCVVGPGTDPCPAVDLTEGTQVRLVAEPEVGSTFDGWAQDCALATGNDCWLAMLEPKSADASFSEVVTAGYTLNLDVGPNGSATTSRGDGPCGPSGSCTYGYASFDAGETLTITAAPDLGYVAAWDANCTVPARNSCTLNPEALMSVYVDFELEKVSLTITPNGGLEGTVTSDDGFINCSIPTGDGSCSYTYDYGTEVTLTATPGDIPSDAVVFGYVLPWNCGPDGQTCTVTLTMDGNKGDLWGWYLY